MTEFDTWLLDEDINRLWRIANGDLTVIAASTSEMKEFLRVVNHAVMIKMGGDGYQLATLQ